MKTSYKLAFAVTIVVGSLLAARSHISQAQPPVERTGGAANLAAPALQAPIPGAAIPETQQPVTFGWLAVSGAKWYEFQLSATADFAAPLFTQSKINTISSYNPGVMLAPGSYWWRVRGTTQKSGGAWSEHRSLTITALALPTDAPTNPPLPTATMLPTESPTNPPAPTATALPTEAPTNPPLPTATPLPTETSAPAPTSPPAASDLRNQRPYTDNSPWNTPIGANPVYDPNWQQMVSTLGTTSTGGKIYSDTTRYTYPVYFADASTPRYDVPCVRYKCTLVIDGVTTRVATMTGVPIPTGARVAAGTDAQMIVIDTTTGREYGFFHGRWTTTGGYEVDNGYSYSIQYDGAPASFGSRGAGVTYYAGLIRPWEIRAGVINHAIAFAYDSPIATKCIYPATQTDGPSTNPYAIPEGARIQLNPALPEADFDRMGLSNAGRIVARALQQYGMILIDTGGSPKIMAEDLIDNPFAAESWADPDLGYTKEVIAGIPYTEFRVLALPAAYWDSTYTPNWGRCIR